MVIHTQILHLVSTLLLLLDFDDLHTSNVQHILLKTKGKINGGLIIILHDDGSTHNFIYERTMKALNLHCTPSTFEVKVAFANTKYNCLKEVKNLEIEM